MKRNSGARDSSLAEVDDRPVRPARLTRSGIRRSEKVAENLARQIVNDMRNLASGTVLPSEAVMLETYDVGRPSLREALRLLEFNGLITMRSGPGGGPRIADVDSTHYGRMTSLYLHRSLVTYRNVLEARLVLEPVMARLAAQSGDGESIAELLRLAKAAPSTVGQSEHLTNVEAFHELINQMAGNDALGLTALSFQEIFASSLAGAVVPTEHRPHNYEVHLQIAKAIAARKADIAEVLMREHMEDYAKRAESKNAEMLDQVVSWH